MSTQNLKATSGEKAWALVSALLGINVYNALLNHQVQLICLAAIGVFYLLQVGILFYLHKNQHEALNILGLCLKTSFVAIGAVSYFLLSKAYIYLILYVVFLLAGYSCYLQRKKAADPKTATSILVISLSALSLALVNALSLNLL